MLAGSFFAGAAIVWACEWNSHALGALRRNLAANGVADRCRVLPGDCALTAPKVGAAERPDLRRHDAAALVHYRKSFMSLAHGK